MSEAKKEPSASPGKAPLGSFTLIELLIVIAILAVLAIAVVLILNPTELLKESRDTTRIQDLAVVNKALALVQTDTPSASFGTSTFVYVSIPDSSATCSNLGLPALPAGYTYVCAPTSTLTKTDGTGWIPVSFDSLSFGAPFSKLPTDPTNTTSSGLYYTYIPGGSWELTALMESAKRRLGGDKDVASTDGGDSYGVYEVGSDLVLNPLSDDGLVGYWKLDEGSGTFADSSGNGNTGTQSGGVSYAQTGKVGKAVGFDGVNDYARIQTSASTNLNSNFSVSMWFKTSVSSGALFDRRPGDNSEIDIFMNTGGGIQTWIRDTLTNKPLLALTGLGLSDNQWHNLVYVRDTATDYVYTYVDSALIGSVNDSTTTNLPLNTSTQFGAYGTGSPGAPFNGSIDDVRIYNRALSAAEAQTLYNATR